jgi:redox-sensitive bicupin YhaK (pirin superfamily)
MLVGGKEVTMPAITADSLVLPRIPRPDVTAHQRPVTRVVPARHAVEGDGFEVRRPFPGALSLYDADPFLLLDHMGRAELAPGEAKGTPWHPHRGFETVTYLLDGALEHRDSTGGGGLLTDGATQWMTAGAGILHVERPTEGLLTSGGVLHGVQLWVNLPARDKMTAPRYQDIEANAVELLTDEGGSSLLRLIAGDLAGHRGPGATWTPITYVHATIAPGAQLSIPWPTNFNALAYVLDGVGTAGEERRPIGEADLAVFGAGDAITLTADARQPEVAAAGMDVLVLGGQPIGEPIYHHGPFVMNTRAEIVQAFEDFQAGRLGRIPSEAR